jgi:methionine--tRNA ligase beta chain
MSFLQKIKNIIKSKEVKDLKNDFTDKLDDLKKDASETISKIDDKFEISEKIEDVKEKIEDKYEEVDKKYSITGKIDGIKEKADDIADDIKEKAEHAAAEAKEKAMALKNKIELSRDNKISYDDFTKVEMKVGEIISAEQIKKSDKLMLLKVDVGEEEPRQVVSGIAKFFDEPTEFLTGKQAIFVTNLEPRTIFGYESNGMIVALTDSENSTLINPMKKIKNGTQAG